jgi:hypothetical protein
MDTQKQAYRRPELVEYGRLAQLTLGQSGPTHDILFGMVTDTPCDPELPQVPNVLVCS